MNETEDGFVEGYLEEFSKNDNSLLSITLSKTTISPIVTLTGVFRINNACLYLLDESIVLIATSGQNESQILNQYKTASILPLDVINVVSKTSDFSKPTSSIGSIKKASKFCRKSMSLAATNTIGSQIKTAVPGGCQSRNLIPKRLSIIVPVNAIFTQTGKIACSQQLSLSEHDDILILSNNLMESSHTDVPLQENAGTPCCTTMTDISMKLCLRFGEHLFFSFVQYERFQYFLHPVDDELFGLRDRAEQRHAGGRIAPVPLNVSETMPIRYYGSDCFFVILPAQ
uniref:Uncharacterized protein n=1 Tax=Romanomermis culicivorax TaxID=13658 RepID=A0A915HSS6_ROMCU